MKETARGGASAIGVPLATLWHDYYALTKPRVVAVMLLTAVVGMLLATQDGDIPWHALCWGTLGIGLAASSAAAINQIVDRRLDALMARTRQRPIPQGHIPAHQCREA